MKSTTLKRIGIAVIILVLLVIGFKWLTRPKPISVVVSTVDSGKVETTVANTRAGSVMACRRAKVSPPSGGLIAELPVHKGQRVQAGQLLLSLWSIDLQSREKVAVNQLATAQSRINEVCQLAAANASDASQARQLRAKGFISEQSLTRSEAQAASSNASCQAARGSAKEAESRIVSAKADTQRTVLRAPFAGIVAEINGEVGEYLTPSPPGIQTLPAVDLIDDSCLYVSAPIDEVDAARLRVGMPARISLDAYRGKHFTATVRRIAPYVLALEKQARTVEVEVEFNNNPASEKRSGSASTSTEEPLLVGYSADIEVVADAREKTLRIPAAALMPGNKVLVLNSDGVLEQRDITTGLSNWEFSEVKSGLKQGEKVVTSLDRDGVKAGAKAVVDDKPAAASK